MNFLASLNARFYFAGVSAHSASQGHIGRSALEGVEMMSVGANYLRGHVERDVCVNYAVLDAGGTAANNFPAQAVVAYKIRANTMEKAMGVMKRLEQIAQGAALMSGTDVRAEYISGSSELIPNRALERLMHEKFLEVGPPACTREDMDAAREIRKAFPANAEESTVNTLRMLYGEAAEGIIPLIAGKAINDVIYPYVPIARAKYGSTDVCDVSFFTPVAQMTTACYAKDTPGHSWFQVSQGKNHLCHNGMLTAAKVMALSGIALYEQPDKLREARAEWEDKRKQKRYVSPVPEKPPAAVHTMN
jgi:aminobenzoyl-glutamate utilization protein B